MSLLVTGVLGDEVEVFSTDDEGSVHFGGDDSAGEDTTADRYHAGEGTFLVCVVGLRISHFSRFVSFLARVAACARSGSLQER